jgi:hypothetical protein
MDGLKLLRRSEDDLENEIKKLGAIMKYINMNFGFESCANLCLKVVGSGAKHTKEAHLKTALKTGPR